MTSKKQSTKRAKTRTDEIRTDAMWKKFDKITEMNKSINSDPRGGRRSMSDRYTASKGGKIEMPKAKPC